MVLAGVVVIGCLMDTFRKNPQLSLREKARMTTGAPSDETGIFQG